MRSRRLLQLLSIGLVGHFNQLIRKALTFQGNFLLAFLTPYANEGIGYSFGFVFFACNFIAAGIVYFFVFESRALSLESVDMMYSDGSIKPRASKKWVPPGYINRLDRDESYWHRPSEMGNTHASGLPANSMDEKHYDKDDSSPERGLSVHREHAANNVRI